MTEQEKNQNELAMFCSHIMAEHFEAVTMSIRDGHITTKLQVFSSMLDLIATDMLMLVGRLEQL